MQFSFFLCRARRLWPQVWQLHSCEEKVQIKHLQEKYKFTITIKEDRWYRKRRKMAQANAKTMHPILGGGDKYK